MLFLKSRYALPNPGANVGDNELNACVGCQHSRVNAPLCVRALFQHKFCFVHSPGAGWCEGVSMFYMVPCAHMIQTLLTDPNAYAD